MEKRYSVLKYIVKTKKNAEGKGPIFFRVTLSIGRVEFSSKRYIDPKEWNNNARFVKGTSAEVKELNMYLRQLERHIEDAFTILFAKQLPFTLFQFKRCLAGKEQPRQLSEIMIEHNVDMQKLVDKGECAKGTLKNHETTHKHVLQFLKEEYQVADLDIRDVDYRFFEKFALFCKIRYNMGHSTSMKHVKNFKKIMLACIRRGWIVRAPFLEFKSTVRKKKAVYLNRPELISLMQREFAAERLTIIRDIFVFMCFTGLAYADVKKLKKADIRKGDDGELWAFTYRQKTKTDCNIPLFNIPLLILEKYKGHPRVANSGLALPVYSNQKTNEYLKEVAALCGITKELTSHMARHTFGTTVARLSGFDVLTTGGIMGHEDFKSMQHYQQITGEKVMEDFQAARPKIEKLENDMMAGKIAVIPTDRLNTSIIQELGTADPGNKAVQEAVNYFATNEFLPFDIYNYKEYAELGIAFDFAESFNEGKIAFFKAILPSGWRKHLNGDTLHVQLLDEKGLVRIDFNYKGSDYCHCRFITRFITECLINDTSGGICEMAVKDAKNGRHLFTSGAIKLGNYGAALTVARGVVEAYLVARFPDWKNPAAYWAEAV